MDEMGFALYVPTSVEVFVQALIKTINKINKNKRVINI
ncbi:Hypothetical protein NATL1_11631 [Prochlorococcus marinus str. NATL1A]|nr:Hypothetical protein NATL1_11631 [Prochlorococcus marinus str. NATL1A]